MALFSMNVSHVSRRTGAHIVRYAAYRAGERLKDHETGRTHDYTSKSDVLHKEILAPEGAPDWARDRERLWNTAERAERRRDSRLAQEVYVAIPREIPPDRRLRAVREFAKETFVARGMVADIAIHSPLGTDGKEIPHAHILLTTRGIEGDGFGRKQALWSHPMRCREFRAAWELHANTAFANAGMLMRIDRRSLVEQRREVERKLDHAVERGLRSVALRLADRAASLDRVPEPSHSRATSHMEKKGIRTRRGDQIREVRRRNRLSLDERRRQRRLEVERAFRRQRIERIKSRVLGRSRQTARERERFLEPSHLQREAPGAARWSPAEVARENRREREVEQNPSLQQPEPWRVLPGASAKRRSRLSLYFDGSGPERGEREDDRGEAQREGREARSQGRERSGAERGAGEDGARGQKYRSSAEEIQAIIDGTWKPSREQQRGQRVRERERGDDGLGLG